MFFWEKKLIKTENKLSFGGGLFDIELNHSTSSP